MEKILLSVLNMSLTASYLIVFIMFLRLPLKRAPKVISYLLWGFVAFRLICPFAFESTFSFMPANITSVSHDFVSQQNLQINNGSIGNPAVTRIFFSSSVDASVNSVPLYIQIGSYIWILGIIAMVIYSIVSFLTIKRHLQSAEYIECNIYETTNLRTPFVLGVFRPRIYIPAGLMKEEKRYIICHEETHIHRFDHIIKPFAFLVLSIHWFNPLVWIAFVLMSNDMELSCDEKVIKVMGEDIKKAYSASLLSFALGKRILNGSPLAFGEGHIKARIKNILDYKTPALWVIVVTIVCFVVLGIGLLSDPKQEVSVLDEQIIPEELQFVRTDSITPTGSQKNEIGGGTQGLSSTEDSTSHEIIHFLNEEIRVIVSLSGDDAQLAEDVIMNYMIKSAAWPGIDLQTLDECYLLRVTYSDGTITDYYAYLLNGNAVMQMGMNGRYSRIDNDLYENLVKLVQNSTETDESLVRPINITENAERSNLDVYITNAVYTANTMHYNNGDLASEAHTVLKIVENDNMVTVYVMVLYLEFKYSDNGFSESGGSHMPVAITFEKNDFGGYTLREYWMPQDGSQYTSSIKQKFPSDIYNDALDTQKYIITHIQSCYERAIEYYKCDVVEEIGGLIETIASSPAHMSNPQAYIQEHKTEYRKLIYYGNHTLRYCFALFEQGGQTGLEGQIMASACRDILGKAEDIVPLANTGQDWYEAFRESAIDLKQQYGDAYLKKNQPGCWLLMQMLDITVN